jgi:hypothetical protein
MKRLILSFLVILLLLPGSVAGQNHGHGMSTTRKLSTVFGRVSEDGKGLIGKNGEPWLVTNPETLLGHQGQQVKVKCQKSSDSHTMRVLSLKMVPAQTKYAANLGDSAFRR